MVSGVNLSAAQLQVAMGVSLNRICNIRVLVAGQLARLEAALHSLLFQAEDAKEDLDKVVAIILSHAKVASKNNILNIAVRSSTDCDNAYWQPKIKAAILAHMASFRQAHLRRMSVIVCRPD
ncbi:hypothetical protein MBANPS3_011584 [Mucor bainieri]